MWLENRVRHYELESGPDNKYLPKTFMFPRSSTTVDFFRAGFTLSSEPAKPFTWLAHIAHLDVPRTTTKSSNKWRYIVGIPPTPTLALRQALHNVYDASYAYLLMWSSSTWDNEKKAIGSETFRAHLPNPAMWMNSP